MITKEQAKEKTEFLLDQLNSHMKNKIDQALNSGAIDLAEFDDNYYLPKIVAYALMKEGLFQTEPLSDGKKKANNLYRCI